jgi:hypothetical protein
VFTVENLADAVWATFVLSAVGEPSMSHVP